MIGYRDKPCTAPGTQVPKRMKATCGTGTYQTDPQGHGRRTPLFAADLRCENSSPMPTREGLWPSPEIRAVLDIGMQPLDCAGCGRGYSGQ
jgi:hypothetical protein